MKQSHKTLLLWILIVGMFFATIWQFLSSNEKPATQVAFSDCITYAKAPADQQHVEQVSIKDREYQFTLVDPTKANQKEAEGRLRPRQERRDDASSSSTTG